MKSALWLLPLLLLATFLIGCANESSNQTPSQPDESSPFKRHRDPSQPMPPPPPTVGPQGGLHQY